MSAYRNLYEQYADDAAFLWLLRGIAVDLPNYGSHDLLKLDQRLEAKLDGLMTNLDESWEVCTAAMNEGQAGEFFVATVLAFHSLDIAKIQSAVEFGLAAPDGFKGLVSALAWLPGQLCHSWIKRFFTSKDLNHKYLAVAACSLRREDPREYLTAIFQREDCLAHDKLYVRALRLVGELKRRDLFAVLSIAMQSKNHEVLFWANWSAVLLGDKSAVKNLQAFVLNEGPLQNDAIELAFKALPVEISHDWISALARDPKAIRKMIQAAATLGDPQAITWLIAQMRVPELTRLAGEAFTTITGINLEGSKLALKKLSDLDGQLPANGPNEDPADSNVDLNDDERLPFPDADKIASVWQQYQQQFIPGQRYFMGRVMDAEHLATIYASGNQRQRRAAALELALLQPAQYLMNHALKELMEE